jgi:pimeloyl-ACP methyl ester carboxylesterase
LATGRPKDPSDLGLQFDECEFSSGQHHPLPAWRIKGNATHCNAPILVMLHGWGRSRWDSLTRVEPFRNACSEIVLIDLPAHGEHLGAWSALGVREPACVVHALHELARQFPNSPFLLAGHSMGAGIAIRAANLAATDFQGNTSENKGIFIAGVIAFAPYSTLRSPIPARLALQNLPAWLFAPIAFLTLRILGRMDGPLEKDARELRAPLLVMAGDHDPISPLADAQKISSAAPRGTLIVLPYQRHDDLRLGDAEQFDRALANFLNSIKEP